MTDSLLIGTSGWTDDRWNGTFYPSHLPEEWRFCYYSNKLRSVLVPQNIWSAAGTDQLQQWLRDSDPDFRFVLEVSAPLAQPLPLTLYRTHLEGFRRSLSLVRAQTAGALVRVPASVKADLGWLEDLLQRLVVELPVCVDLSGPGWRDPAALDSLARAGAGLCWHADRDQAPRQMGRFVVGLASATSPGELRRLIEAMAKCSEQDILTGLFFDGAGAPKAAQAARVIAELLGV